ncbi:MAG: hypothetical protein JNL67_19895 [Planctomycetaceae bacterium]|nr:hypothetical protein [Planctomycetaceae bacterium]
MCRQQIWLIVWKLAVFNFLSRGAHAVVVSLLVLIASQSVAVSITICTAFMLIEALARVMLFRVIKNWPTGKLTEISLTTQCGHSDYGYRIDCCYSFEVSKVRYFGNVVNPFVQEGASNNESLKQRVASIESITEVIYFQTAPQICLLDPPNVELLRYEIMRLFFVNLLFIICLLTLERFGAV